MPSHRTVLLIEDDIQTRRILKGGLVAQRFRVVAARTAGAAISLVANEKFALIVLDVDLPDQDGLSLLGEIRRLSSVPLIMLAARNDEAAQIKALDGGADDYIIKPFGVGEFLARARTAIRHRLQAAGTQPVLRLGDLEIDLVNHQVRRKDTDIRLTRTEMSLLRLFVEHPDKVLTHEFILKNLRGLYDTRDSQYLRVYIRTLRNKIGGPDETVIQTVTGMGYRLALPVTASRVS